ncbi:hypothetical protein PAXRUDRAFT_148906, partial [Paxillus rubicundulus Ve08.2h10]
LLDLVSQVSDGKSKVTLRNEANLCKAYNNTAIILTPISCSHYIPTFIKSPTTLSFDLQ